MNRARLVAALGSARFVAAVVRFVKVAAVEAALGAVLAVWAFVGGHLTDLGLASTQADAVVILLSPFVMGLEKWLRWTETQLEAAPAGAPAPPAG